MKTIYLLFMIFGVFGDEVKSVSVSVMEGDSLTLHTHLTDTQADDVTVTWTYGAQKTHIAQINREAKETSIYDDVLDGRFRYRVQLDDQNGDLTITNITTQHTGDYEVEITVRSKIIQKSFKVTGMSGAGGVKSVSVMDGDSVSLHTDDLDIKKYDVIRWRFQHENSPLAELNRNTALFSTYDDVLDGRFKDKLQLDVKTGDLTIRNIRTRHSGLYEVNITSTSSNYTIHQSCTVAVSGEVKSVSVIEGDPVTLQTHLNEIQRDELIVWTFLPDDSQIAQIYKLNNLFRTYDGEEGRFRDRLKLNDQTGDLTITDIRPEHIGVYEVKINNRRRSIQRRFSVHVSGGLSSGGIAGIAVFFLLLIAAAAVALNYFTRKISELQKQLDKKMTVETGHCAVLHTNLKELKATDKIKWRFEQDAEMKNAVMHWPWRYVGTLIAKHDEQGHNTYDFPDEGFREKMNLDRETGGLYISDVSNKHSGVYQLKITSGGETSYKRFIVSVIERIVVVDKGDYVPLKTEVTDIKRDDLIEWRFGETLIAQINPANKIFSTYDGDKGRFRDKLTLNHQTGDLNISDISEEHKGVYKLKIIRNGETSYRSLYVSLYGEGEELEVNERESVDLKTEVHDIQKGDLIEWRFRETLIAQINPVNNICSTYDGDYDDDEFRDKLNLNPQNGDLTISDFRQKHAGVYKLKIISDGETSYKKFIVFVIGETKTLFKLEGDSVDLKTNLNDTHTVDLIEWTFEETLIAKINPSKNIFSTYDGDDDLFRDKLNLNRQTGDLNIAYFTLEHRGVFTLKIIRDGKTSYKRFNLVYVGEIEEQHVYKGESVDLKINLTDIKRDDVMVWKFRKTLIAEFNPANDIFRTYDGDDDLFRDKLTLNHQTGDLNIKDIREEHNGEYILKITRDAKNSCRKFDVLINGEKEDLQVYEGKSVDLKTEVTEIQKVDVIEWRFGDKETLIAEIIRAHNVFRTHDGNYGAFRDKLKLNHQTGDLNINDFRQEHSGVYTLKIIRGGKTSYRRFFVLVKGNVEVLRVNGEKSVNLKSEVKDIHGDDVIEWRFKGTLIAEINPANNIFSTYDGVDDLFRDKLKLIRQTGDLKINDIREEHTGDYTLKIIRDGETSYKRFTVCLITSRGEYSVEKRGGDSVGIEMPLLPKSTSRGEDSVEIEMPLLCNSSQ
nr:uncharacterized protein LOC129453463 isoform X2 [Misgurnus anguillicaudatus]